MADQAKLEKHLAQIEALRELASEICNLLKGCMEAGVPEAEDALAQCKVADSMLAKLHKAKSREVAGDASSGRGNSGERWDGGAAEPVLKNMTDIRAKARKLLEKRKVLKGLYGTSRFSRWQLTSSAEYREAFLRLALEMEKSLSNFRVLCKLDTRLNVENPWALIQNEDARKMWKDTCSEYWRVDWARFNQSILKAMEAVGLPLQQEGIQRIKFAVCVGHGDTAGVSCYAFNAACQKYGFPFDVSVMPERPNKEPERGDQLSVGERLAVSREVTELAQALSAPDLAQAIRTVTDYLKADLSEGPDKWAACLKDAELAERSAEEVKRAQRVDEGRRRWAFFYVRFMMLWRLGTVAQDLFADLDFPGEHRIVSFLKYCEPLDEAYFRVVSRGERLEWDRKRPKVYVFLRLLLREVLKFPEKDIPAAFGWRGAAGTMSTSSSASTLAAAQPNFSLRSPPQPDSGAQTPAHASAGPSSISSTPRVEDAATKSGGIPTKGESETSKVVSGALEVVANGTAPIREG